MAATVRTASADTLDGVHLRSLLPALVAAVTLPLFPSTSTTPAAAATHPTEDDSPLRLTLTSMTPSSLPSNGPVRLRGTVTNTTDETWSAVNVYPFASWNGVEPTVITSRAQLAAEHERDPDEAVGERYTDTENFRTIRELEPGETASYTATISADDVRAVTQAGVYWVGVHAMGESASVPRDGYADGRARTFIPLVPTGTAPVPTTLVAPIREEISNAPDGSIDDVRGWTGQLSDDGRMAQLLAFGKAASVPVTWLVDPAVPQAVERLAAGNPSRALDPTDGAGPDSEPSGSSSPSQSEDPSADASPSEDADAGESSPEPTAAERRAADAARSWLDGAGSMLAGNELLLLPFGDVDVNATAARDPEWYLRARERSGSLLETWQLPGTPAISSPGGLLSGEAIAAAPEGTTVLVSNAAFEDPATVPVNVTLNGRQVVVTDPALAQGGPGPDDPMGPVALRQQLLATVALQALSGEPEPVVAPLPAGGVSAAGGGSPSEFFEGLDAPWLTPTTLASLTNRISTVVPDDRFRVEAEDLRTLPPANLAAARQLAETGAQLGRVLFRNDAVAEEVGDQALAATSYAAAGTPVLSRIAVDRSQDYLRGQLASIRMEPPLPVTLSSKSGGDFGVTLINDLDQPVEVRLVARSDGEVEIRTPGVIRLQPGARTTVTPRASTDVLGLHKTRLQVTDVAGNPLGASAIVEVRATQVSRVIWVVIAVGLVLLFSAILLRIYRRAKEALK